MYKNVRIYPPNSKKTATQAFTLVHISHMCCHCIVMGNFLHHLSHLFEIFHLHFQRRSSLLLTQVESISSHVEDEVEEDADACKACNKPIVSGDVENLSSCDAETVMERLGLWSSAEGQSGLLVMDGAYRLLEEKEASLEELEEAFGVFDENGDGQISASELRSVMQRLGLEEGMILEDCQRMIEAFDEDADGKISFNEFKNMLEHAL